MNSLYLVFLLLPHIYGQQQRQWTQHDCQEISRSCQPLPKGSQGPSGKAGPPGRRGAIGHPGVPGEPGERGYPARRQSRSGTRPPGPSAPQGERGIPGFPGPFGDPGQIGPEGIKGLNGLPGLSGPIGAKGAIGKKGSTGQRGPSAPSVSPWIRCVWTIDSKQVSGVIKECVFSKKQPSTSIHVIYDGAIQLGLCRRCCKRWYFTFNDVECSTPSVIDAIMSGGLRSDFPHQTSGRIEGICENTLPQGQVRIALRIEDCPGIPAAPGSLGQVDVNLHNTKGRILIREVTSSQ